VWTPPARLLPRSSGQSGSRPEPDRGGPRQRCCTPGQAQAGVESDRSALDLSRLLAQRCEYQRGLWRPWHRSSMSQRGDRRPRLRRLRWWPWERAWPALVGRQPPSSLVHVFGGPRLGRTPPRRRGTSPTSTTAGRAAAEAGDAVDGGRAPRQQPNHRHSGLLTGHRPITSWAPGQPPACRCLISARRTDRPELRLDTEDQRDLLACFHRLLASLLRACCAPGVQRQRPRLSPASSPACWLWRAKQPQQEAPGLPPACGDADGPSGCTGCCCGSSPPRCTRLPSRPRLVSGGDARPVRTTACGPSCAWWPRRQSRGQQLRQVVQPEFEFLFAHYASTRSARTTSCSANSPPCWSRTACRCWWPGGSPLAVAAAAAACCTDLRAGQTAACPLGCCGSPTCGDRRVLAVAGHPAAAGRAAADHAIEVRPVNLGMLESTIRPLNELLRRLGLLDAATAGGAGCWLVAASCGRCCRVCALVAFDRPVANMRLPQKPQEPKYLRWILTSIIKSHPQTPTRIRMAGWGSRRSLSGRGAAACASWSPVLRPGGLASLPAARTDLVDEAAEMLPGFCPAFSISTAARGRGGWGLPDTAGLLLAQSAVTMRPCAGLARAAPAGVAAGLGCGAALSALPLQLHPAAAGASMGERRRHIRDWRAASRPAPGRRSRRRAQLVRRLSAPTRADLRRAGCRAACGVRRLGESQISCELLSAGRFGCMLADLPARLLGIPTPPHASRHPAHPGAGQADEKERQRADAGLHRQFTAASCRTLDEANGAPAQQAWLCDRAVSESSTAAGENARSLQAVAPGSAAELADDRRRWRCTAAAVLRGSLAASAGLALLPAPLAAPAAVAGRLIEPPAAWHVRGGGAWIGATRRPPGGDGFKLPVKLLDCTTQHSSMTGCWSFKRERAVLLRLSGLCQELQSPKSVGLALPAPAYYLAALRSGAEAELPAGLRRAGRRHRRAASLRLRSSQDGASIEEAAARLERLLHGAIVLPPRWPALKDAFLAKIWTKSDGEDEEIF
uniref:Protein kinase domain-containing protein n=1 Tax=Macrostomum lignano TaxID=282301 RepID=A0A1I8FKX6_9PLAT